MAQEGVRVRVRTERSPDPTQPISVVGATPLSLDPRQYPCLALAFEGSGGPRPFS